MIKHWTTEEDKQLASLVTSGARDREIASALGRTKSAVVQRRCMFGLRLVRPSKPKKASRSRTQPECVAAICELIENGLTPTAVSRRIGISIGLVEYYARRDGALGPSPKMRCDVRPIDTDLVMLSIEGKSRQEIARRLGITHSVVRGRLTTLARREAIAENKLAE